MDDKSKSLEAVLAKLTHDLRTPLAVVHTTTTMLLNPKYNFSEAQVREQHERIQRNVELMNRLIGELSLLAGETKTTHVDEV
jgi:K+-sensing histidine kinase KdpD